MPNEVQIITPDDERVKRGLATIAGYGGALAALITWVLSQAEAFHLNGPTQITLLIISGVLVAVTGKGRQDQAAANRTATATVQAALMAPVPPPLLEAGDVLPEPDGPDEAVQG